MPELTVTLSDEVLAEIEERMSEGDDPSDFAGRLIEIGLQQFDEENYHRFFGP